MSWKTATRHLYTEGTIKAQAYDGAGCYYIFDFGNNLTYIGSSVVSCKDRLLNHHRGDEGTCTADASNYQFGSEYQVNPRASERSQLEEYQRENGRLPKCNDRIP